MKSLALNSSIGFDILTVFCVFDDLANSMFGQSTKVGRPSELSCSEAVTIIMLRSTFNIRDMSHLYTLLVTKFKGDFPNLPNYKNFVATLNRYTPQLLRMIKVLSDMNRKTAGTIKIVDSTAIPASKIYRASSNKVMKGVATKSKTTTGWFYGIKLHTVVDLEGNILNLAFTTARVDERKVLDSFFDMLKNSIILADAGYLSKELSKKAKLKNILLLTPTRKNMKKITTLLQNLLLNLRGRVETMYSVLKERLGLVSTLARSVHGFFAHCIRVIFTYMFQPITTRLTAI